MVVLLYNEDGVLGENDNNQGYKTYDHGHAIDVVHPNINLVSMCVSTLKKIGEVTYGSGSNQRTRNVVTSSDKKRLLARCHPHPRSYDVSLCDFDLLCVELFQENEVWVSIKLLPSVVWLIAWRHGWKASTIGPYIQCSCYNRKITARKRKMKGGDLAGEMLLALDPKDFSSNTIQIA